MWPRRWAGRGALRRVPLVLMEADSHLGLTNRVLAPLARPGLPRLPDRRPRRRPLRGHRAASPHRRPRTAPPPARFSIAGDEQCVLVFGGSQGARSINQAAIEAFAGARVRVLHAAGTRDLPDLAAPGPHYDLRGYIEEFGEALLAADLVASPAPAARCSRSPRYGRPMILIPYPYARPTMGRKRPLFGRGAAVMIADAELGDEAGSRRWGGCSATARGWPRWPGPPPALRARGRPGHCGRGAGAAPAGGTWPSSLAPDRRTRSIGRARFPGPSRLVGDRPGRSLRAGQNAPAGRAAAAPADSGRVGPHERVGVGGAGGRRVERPQTAAGRVTEVRVAVPDPVVVAQRALTIVSGVDDEVGSRSAARSSSPSEPRRSSSSRGCRW